MSGSPRRLPLRPELVEQARAYAAGEASPAEPRDAATVVLVRDSPRPPDEGPGRSSGVGTTLEVHLLRRQASMAFASGMAVFPGGSVDPRDFTEDLHGRCWAGPSPAEWAGTLGCDEAKAQALLCAAVRETFEESGVLLAGSSVDSVVSDTTGEDWEADRVALESRQLSMTDFLTRRGLVLRSDLLGPWSGWLTPIFEPRRYRTWFFLAVLPEGQVTRHVTSEAASVAWLPVADAVAAAERGEIMMMPPTYLTCLDVAQHATSTDACEDAAGRTVEMFTPTVVPSGDAGSSEEFVLSTPPRYDSLLAARFGSGEESRR